MRWILIGYNWIKLYVATLGHLLRKARDNSQGCPRGWVSSSISTVIAHYCLTQCLAGNNFENRGFAFFWHNHLQRCCFAANKKHSLWFVQKKWGWDLCFATYELSVILPTETIFQILMALVSKEWTRFKCLLNTANANFLAGKFRRL